MSIRAFSLTAAAAAVALGSFSIVPAYAQTPTPTPTPTATATPDASALRITARAESGCGVATWVATVADGQPFQIFENVDGEGWEPINTESTTGFVTHAGAGVVAFRVVQGGDSIETGPIALFQCENHTPTPTASGTPSPTVTAAPTVTPTAGVTPTGTPTVTATPSATPSATPAVTPSATPATPTATAGPPSNGLANTGGEKSSTSIEIEINGTKISITAPGNGKPIIVTENGKPTSTPTVQATPSPSATPTGVPAGDTQDDEIAEQQAEQGPPQSRADEVFAETNKARAAEGLPPLERDDCLDTAAGRHATVMIGDYRHSTNTEMDTIIEECDLPELSENIATGQESPAEVVQTWLNSTKGHREAMLSPTATHMGTGATDSNTWIQLFTTRDGQTPEQKPGEASQAKPAPAATPSAKPENGLTPAAANLQQSVTQKWPGLEISGVRQDAKPDHPSGRAIDIMTGGNSCSPVGQEIADWAKTNADELGVEYVIWCSKIWSVERSDEGWRPNIGHADHVHITVNDAKGSA